MQIRSILIFFTFLPFFLSAQLEENFDGSSISSLTDWSGDLDDFIINEDDQLQLSASQKGNSVIYSSISLEESAEWQISFVLDFAPSTSNQLRIYLYADDLDLLESNGYFIEVGESGSEDKLKFYHQVDGNKSLIGAGTMPRLGADPASAKIKIIKKENGIWSFFTAYDDAPFEQLEFELSDSSLDLGDGFFGLSCKYSETRKDKFFFDDIYAGPITIDVEGPILVSASFVNATQIRLIFSELVSPDIALDPSTFTVSNGVGNPTNVSFGEFENELLLDIDPAVDDGVEYVLSIIDIEDLYGNKLTIDREIFLSSLPLKGDLVINEILFDPQPGSDDFVELYNISDKYLSLNGLIIQNLDNNSSVILGSDLLMKPLQYLAITSNATALNKDFKLLIPENIVEHKLPAWSNAGGNVSLTREGLSELIDSYDYTEDLHSEWIDDTEGVSLERIDPYLDADLHSNWQSATEQSGFATPGYKNSNFSMEFIEKDEFWLEKRTFSPDGDGFDDILELKYRVVSIGSVLNMRVFDDRGHLVKTLANNEILGREGGVIWDGTTDDSTLGKMGIYVIWIEYFDTDGSITHKKLSCVLAKQLD